MDLVARPFQPPDLEQLNRWYVAHGQHAVTMDGIPHIGFVVDDVAAGFMYKADGKLGILEFWVSNPDATSDERHRAWTAIGNELLKEAIRCKLTRLWAISREADVIDRAKEWEFKSLGNFELLVRSV